ETQLERGGGGSRGGRIESRSGHAVIGNVAKLVLSADPRYGRLSAQAAPARVLPTSRSVKTSGAKETGGGSSQSACLRGGLATDLAEAGGHQSHELLSRVEERMLDPAWPPGRGVEGNSRPPPADAGNPEGLQRSLAMRFHRLRDRR